MPIFVNIYLDDIQGAMAEQQVFSEINDAIDNAIDLREHYLYTLSNIGFMDLGKYFKERLVETVDEVAEHGTYNARDGRA